MSRDVARGKRRKEPHVGSCCRRKRLVWLTAVVVAGNSRVSCPLRQRERESKSSRERERERGRETGPGNIASRMTDPRVARVKSRGEREGEKVRFDLLSRRKTR